MKKNFDPMQYIESAFLDRTKETEKDLPSIKKYVAGQVKLPRGKFRKTEMSAPRPRRKSNHVVSNSVDPELQKLWTNLPKSVMFLSSLYDDSVTAHYYSGDFKETRQDLIKRLLNPQLNLEEVSRLLGVCPVTVRRYTTRGWINHHRTPGGQRRFLLSDVIQFVETHGRFPKE
jgi:excisionase family DNA binding protein